jgi:hypothetical protein
MASMNVIVLLGVLTNTLWREERELVGFLLLLVPGLSTSYLTKSQILTFIGTNLT